MEDFPVKFAGLLESVAARVRALTVDRAEKAIRLTGMAIIAATLGMLAILFLFLTLYTSLEIPLGEWGARAVLAGLFGLGGVFMWSRRTSTHGEDRNETE